MEEPLSSAELFNRFINNQITAQELEQVIGYFGTADEVELRSLISVAMSKETDDLTDETERLDVIYHAISQKIFDVPKVKTASVFKLNWFVKIAAALLLISVFGLIIYNLNKNGYKIKPGSSEASIQLAGNTSKMIAGKDTVVYKNAGVKIINRKNGTLIYYAMNADSSTASVMNTVETPNGGEYRIILSDGSVIMLNSGSKISFPLAFRGNFRKVSLSGEALFEVTKNPKKPFIVDVEGNSIQVLGTKFNVSNYREDGATIATLLEGSIRYNSKNNDQVILKPGQQIVDQQGVVLLNEVDASDFIAWSKGDFLFSDVPLSVVMQKLGRWYNFETDPKSFPAKNIYMKISRHADISEVLSSLSKATDLKFEIKENKILLRE